MNEQKHDKVKDVGGDDDFLVIELLNGLRLSGPLRTRPIYRDTVIPAVIEPAPAVDSSIRVIVS
jgi:hypothetical protein